MINLSRTLILGFILGVSLLLLLPLISASNEKVIEFNIAEEVNLTGVQCVHLNNSACGTGITCYITALNETQGFLASNVTMINLDNGFRNYNLGFAPNYTTSWSAVVSCDNGGIQSFIISIGEIFSDWETASIIGWSGILFLFVFMGTTVFSREMWAIKTFLFLLASSLAIIIINSANLVSVGVNADKIMLTAFIVVVTASSVMFIYTFIFVFIRTIVKLRDARRRG